MAFNVLTNEGDSSNKKPITSQVGDIKTYSCKEFKGELSSITGIYSKFLYIGRITSELNGCQPANPTIRIICEPECVNECQYLHKPK